MPDNGVGKDGLHSLERGARLMLEGLRDGLGLDLTDENLVHTPQRIARAYAEIFSGLRDTEGQINTLFKSSFPSAYDQIVLSRNVETWSMCPHHFLPVHYNVSLAYIPSTTGRVLGISKLARLVIILARRPVLQEKLTKDITEALMQRLDGCQGAACVVEGQHLCMRMRGVKRNSSIVTSSLEGAFLQPAARAELLQLLPGIRGWGSP